MARPRRRSNEPRAAASAAETGATASRRAWLLAAWRSAGPAVRRFGADPGQNPLARVVALALRCLARHVSDGGGLRAAAIAYYALLSFFPFVLLLAAAASLFIGSDPDEVSRFVGSLRVLLPVLREDFWQDVLAFAQARRAVSSVSLCVFFLIASRVSIATEQALAVVFHLAPEGKGRGDGTLVRRLRAYAMTLVGLALIATVFAARHVGRLLARADQAPYTAVVEAIERVAFTPVLPSLVILSFAYVLFRRVPRTRVGRGSALVGAACFVAGHDGALAVWSRVVTGLLRQDVVYGSFVGIMSLTVWVFWIATLLLLSAEVVADLNGNRRGMPGPQ